MVGSSLNSSETPFDQIDAVSSLQSSNADSIEAQRKHRRFDIRLKVVVQPANPIDRIDQKWLGECHDVSKGGCKLLSQFPLQLGSIYWIQFEPSKYQIDPLFARCVRGRLLRENAFEFGMCFLTPIENLSFDEPTESGESLL